jgi:hypothetical protein
MILLEQSRHNAAALVRERFLMMLRQALFPGE